MKLLHGDCLELMKDIEDQSIDMILCDLPYGTTACKWDIVIPFDKLWIQYERIIKDNGAIVLFGTEPFSSKLRCSNLKLFKYDWIWHKNCPTNFVHAKNQPLRDYENICVFSKGVCIHEGQSENRMIYYPQNLIDCNIKEYQHKKKRSNVCFSKRPSEKKIHIQEKTNYPRQVLSGYQSDKGFHPTQKPVALLTYLIKTYTNENELVLDNCMGSGSTGIACLETNRQFIGIEKEYYYIAKQRIKNHQWQLSLF